MSLTTLADPGVSRAISGIEHVAVDIDEHPDLATKYGVTAVPTFIMLSTSEDEAERITGFQAAGDFLQWVTNGVSEAKADMVRQALARTNLAEVDRLLASTETNSIHEAAMELFDLCGERDTAVVQAAAARLKTMAGRDPSDLLDGLNDPRLAIRIQAANALRYKIGDAFDVDPWSDAVTREKRIPVWREQLAKTPGSKAAN
jgi:thioredoxin-like negative regulator of GroEL